MEIQLHDLNIPAAMHGLRDGIDPALSDAIYSPLESPDMENVRVVTGKWQTRLGYTVWQQIANANECRLLDNLYAASGARTRLAGFGTGNAGKLYYFRQGTDSAFQLASGGSSLGVFAQPYWSGVVLNDRFYFSDRTGAMRRFEVTPASGNQVRPVAQPAAPGAAPSVKARTFAIMEDWTNLSAWVKSDVAGLELLDDTANNPPPGGGKTAHLHPVTGHDQRGQTITRNIANESVASHTIAFWYQQDRARFRTQFSFGTNTATDYNIPINPTIAGEWYPLYVPVGDTPTISFKRFECIKIADTSLRMGPLLLPGRLEGQYRWMYTHYDPATGRESAPSPQSNGGLPLDFSAIGVTNHPETARAFQKAAAVTVTSDAGTDATTTKVRIYRNGGVPSLTKDSRGIDVWLRVGEIYDQSTTMNGAVSAAATTFVVTSATLLSPGDALVLDSGLATEEMIVIKIISGTTVTPKQPLVYAHADLSAVQVAFIDNTANESVDVTAIIDIERNDPPAAARWVQKSSDGRLWLFNYSGHPTGVAVSNKSTPLRLEDYEVFPDGVDPLTRRSYTQGFRFEINGDASDEEIMWGGFFRGYPTVFTRKNLYLITAQSQVEWGPTSIVKIHQVGCINGETVVDCNGVLYWVADGPRVMRWDGVSPPQEVSHLRVNERLNAAPTSDWNYWFACYHVKKEGPYYMLYYASQVGYDCDKRLDYNIASDVWEPMAYFCNCLGFPTPHNLRRAHVRDGASDFRDLYQADDSGNVFQAEIGSSDNGNPIRIRFATKKFPLGAVCLMHQLFCRLTPTGADTATLTVRTGGSEYLDQTQTYTLTLAAGNDEELKVRLHKTLLGHWVQIQIDSDTNNRPGFREFQVRFLPVREGRVSA